MKVPLIVVKQGPFEEFSMGRKTIEYRRYGRMFNERVFCPGRAVRIARSFDIYRYPVIDATVTRFEIIACDQAPPQVQRRYPRLSPDALIALIHLELIEGKWFRR